ENNMDASAIADGSAAKGTDKDGKVSDTAVGVAVAIKLAEMSNDAVVPNTAHVTAEGVSVQAVMKDVGGNKSHNFAAKATSGGSGGDTRVGGSLAPNTVTATGPAGGLG